MRRRDFIALGGAAALTAASVGTSAQQRNGLVVGWLGGSSREVANRNLDAFLKGLKDSGLARPGGNATGLTNFEFSMGSKWVELLKDLNKNITSATLMINPANPNNGQFQKVIASAAGSLGVDVITAPVTNADEIGGAINSAAEKPGSGLIVLPDSLPFVHRSLIIELAARDRVPTMYPFREFSQSGGLISYGLNQAEVYRLAATYVDKILRGAKPAELPVEAPNKFELAINLKAAKAMGITVPPTLLARADEVIE